MIYPSGALRHQLISLPVCNHYKNIMIPRRRVQQPLPAQYLKQSLQITGRLTSNYCGARFLYDQIRARMSPEPVAKRPPLGVTTGLGATEMTEFLWPCSISCVLPVLGSQNWTPRSLEPDRTQFPSGVKATLSTKS